MPNTPRGFNCLPSAACARLEEEPHLYKTKNDISPDRRVELSALLNQRLASAIDLQMQIKQAHWNVKGPNFKWLWFVEAHSQATK